MYVKSYRPTIKIITKLIKVTFIHQRSMGHSSLTMWMTHICKEIPASYALTMPWLPFRLSEPWFHFTQTSLLSSQRKPLYTKDLSYFYQ